MWLAAALAPRYVVLTAFVASGIYVHCRGRERLKLSRQLLDHSALMAPYNALMYLYSAVRARPFAPLEQFPELAPLRDQWCAIRDEALGLLEAGAIRAAVKRNDPAFNSFFQRGWKRFHLKWYDDFLPSAKALCPHTTALLRDIPSVNAAMFALLPAGGRLGKHRDPFAGSLRYHLGLATPNSEHCRIVIDGHAYHWRDGEAVLFDETYVHYAENNTDQARLILFCDVERPLSNPVLRFINRHFGHRLLRAAATQNIEGEHCGVLSRMFGFVFEMREIGQRVKTWHRPTYYGLKWSAVLGLLYVGCR
jgi:beta-hydroxylase